MNEAWGAIGQPVAGGVLLIGDHALAVVPDDIDLGIAPALIVSLHSFTPVLESRPDEARPWDVGVLYNRDYRLAPAAIASLSAQEIGRAHV